MMKAIDKNEERADNLIMAAETTTASTAENNNNIPSTSVFVSPSAPPSVMSTDTNSNMTNNSNTRKTINSPTQFITNCNPTSSSAPFVRTVLVSGSSNRNEKAFRQYVQPPIGKTSVAFNKNKRSFQPKSIKYQSLRYEVPVNRRKDKRSILKSVSGEFKAGQLHAIIGPSGAGKSTLMNVLAGYKIRHMTGTVLVNGKPRDLGAFRKMSCYIMQDDHLLPQLTVMEAMTCSANLKLSESISLEEKHGNILEILDTLGLREARSNRTGKLSGGQRKRLAIAQELINNPPVMFFDEPTSGLDSVTCLQCVQLLKRLALGGRNIICTIHQPSAKVFEIFDTVCVMADGQTIYDGPVNCVIPYFALHNLNCPPYHNPSDFIMEVATGDYGDVIPNLTHYARSGQAAAELQQLMKVPISNSVGTQTPFLVTSGTLPERSSFTNMENEPENADGKLAESPRNFETTFFTQFRILFIRAFITILRDAVLTQLRLFSHIGIAILIGVLYFQIGNDASKVVNNSAYLFVSSLFLNFCAIMPIILTFPSEVLVFLREHLNYWYSLKAYYFAKSAADLPFQITLPIIYTVIAYLMTGQPADYMRFFLFATVIVLTGLDAQSLGLLISSLTRAETAVYIGPVSILPLVLLSGFLVNLNSMPVYFQWMSYFSYMRYSFEGSMIAIYGFNRTGLTCDGIFASPDSPNGSAVSPRRVYACILFSNGDAVLESFSIKDSNVTTDIAALLVFFVMFRVICYFALKWRVNVTSK